MAIQLFDTNQIIEYASEASVWGPLISWQEASRTTTKVAVRNPQTLALPQFSAPDGQAAALAGAALSDTRTIDRVALTVDVLQIDIEDRAVHTLISKSDYVDAKNNPDTTVDLDELVRRDSAARIAATIDALYYAELDTAATVEYVAADGFAAALEAAVAELEDNDIEATIIAAPLKYRTLMRSAVDDMGRYLFDDGGNEYRGIPVKYVSNSRFAVGEVAIVTNPLFAHGAVIPMGSPELLDQTYAAYGQIAFETYFRAGLKLLEPGGYTPAVKIVDETQP